jgi:2-dehydropantoate 2-reductase
MRFIVYGAGGVGGVVGGRLAQHGHSVALIARGRHYEAVRDRGLRVESPDDVVTLELPVFDRPDHVAFAKNDVVLLAVKSQDTLAALDQLAAVAPSDVPIVCMQNGVANERVALRRFANVYGVFVYCATAHLAPGVVQAWYAPTTGILDIGRYPSGVDDCAQVVAAALRHATFLAEARVDIMRWKYRKLLMNLGNAVDALCGSAASGSTIVAEAEREGVECLNAAAIEFLPEDDGAARRRERDLALRPINGQRRGGGSSWQSLERGTRSIETDYLNGEIVLLGRLSGVPTPVNEVLQQLSRRAAAEGKPPGSMRVEDLSAHLRSTKHHH